MIATFILGCVGIAFTEAIVAPTFLDESSFVAKASIGVWISLPYLIWALFSWAARNHLAPAGVTFAAGMLSALLGFWAYHGVDIRNDWFQAAMAMTFVPFVQLLVLNAVVLFGWFVTGLDALERPH